MSAGEFATASRGVDLGFVTRQRARGTPEAAIARMGGWCLADVLAVPLDPPAPPLTLYEPKPPAPTARLVAMMIPDVAEIIYHVAEQYCVSPGDILGPSHRPEFVEPRHEAFAVVYELNRYTLDQIGGIFNKTGPAVLYGLRAHYRRLEKPGRNW